MTDAQSDYSEVVDEDFEELNSIFYTFGEKLTLHIRDNPLLEDDLVEFVQSAGDATKKLLVRYAKNNQLLRLETEDYQNKMQEMRHKIAKMNLANDKLLKAANEFASTKKQKV